MTRIIEGERVGKQGRLRVGCSATLFDADHRKILLTRRADNHLWCLPGGGMDPGESLAETCVREIMEETGLRVRVARLIGVYSSPNWLVEYGDGSRVQIVAMNFEVELVEGEPCLTDEVCDQGFFGPDELEGLDLMANHRQRIDDAFACHPEAFIR